MGDLILDFITEHKVSVSIGISFILAVLLVYMADWPFFKKNGKRVALAALAAGALMGSAVAVLTQLLLTPGDDVYIDRVQTVAAGTPFTISGRGRLTGDHELWVLVLRPSGGFDISSRAPVHVDDNSQEWVFRPVVIGRPPPGPNSPDAGVTYTLSAVIVNQEGADFLADQVASADPAGEVFVPEKEKPPGSVAHADFQVTLPE